MQWGPHNPLGHLLYISDATGGITEADLEAIRSESVTNNGLLGITGILFYSRGKFVQLLEGEPGEVRALFDAIVRDPRHDYVKLLWEQPAKERLFYDWDMAVLDLDAYTDHERNDLDDLVHLAGYQTLSEEERPMTLQILRRFRALLPDAI